MHKKDPLQVALEFAVEAHAGQFDKSGEIYILHPIRVMSHFVDTSDRIIAVLHDVLEDTDLSEATLREEFSTDIVDDIVRLTHKQGEAYFDYLKRVKESARASKIKMADIDDNLSLKRLNRLDPKERSRLIGKYTRAKTFIRN